MFTGLIEEIGHVVDISDAGGSYTLRIAARRVLTDCTVGDSIAVNGVCLTVTAFTAGNFTVDAVPETLRRTNLGALAPGDPVNLERSATPATRLGGHYVQGHVDATGIIQHQEAENEAVWFRIKVPSHLMRYIVSKGYITIDGTSLTVVDTGPDWFSVTLIPHTQNHITLPGKKAGEAVNLETDIIAKYVEKLVGEPKLYPITGDTHALGQT